jgi:voltage-gated potassium channel
MSNAPGQRSAWRERLYVVIFESDTRAGQAFDVVLITVIPASVGAVMLESVARFDEQYGRALRLAEWGFTILFTVEYVLRLLCARRPGRYAASFFGVVDVLAIVPTYASVLVPGAQFLLVIRLLRVLRVFRVLKLVAYLGEANFLMRALRQSRKKITVFLFGVLTMVVLFGTLMYLVEGPENDFTSIPRAIYWAIVTLTTVGFGDISPQTSLGQFLAAILMITGFGIIAVPTGIVTSEMMGSGSSSAGDEEAEGDAHARAHHAARREARGETSDPLQGGTRDAGDAARTTCPACSLAGHDADAIFCKRCGTRLARGG